jgi:hypothetical protein
MRCEISGESEARATNIFWHQAPTRDNEIVVVTAFSLYLFAGIGHVVAQPTQPIQERADRLLYLVNAGYQALFRVNSEAQWKPATDVTPAHDAASETAGKAMAAFTGNPALIEEAKALLKEPINSSRSQCKNWSVPC